MERGLMDGGTVTKTRKIGCYFLVIKKTNSMIVIKIKEKRRLKLYKCNEVL